MNVREGAGSESVPWPFFFSPVFPWLAARSLPLYLGCGLFASPPTSQQQCCLYLNPSGIFSTFVLARLQAKSAMQIRRGPSSPLCTKDLGALLQDDIELLAGYEFSYEVSFGFGERKAESAGALVGFFLFCEG